MKKQELVHVSDCTLLAAEDHYELSFREKIELCRLIDKLGVSAIDLCPIRQKKTDRLLIKSICSAVKNAAVAVEWWRKAAEQGHAKARQNLGTAYERGEGVPMDKEEAAKWLKKD